MGENVDASAELARSLAQMSVDCPWCPKGIKQRNLRSNRRGQLLDDNDTSDEEGGGVADEMTPWDWSQFSESEENESTGSEFHTDKWANWNNWAWGQNKKSGLEPAYEGVTGVKKTKEQIFTEGVKSVKKMIFLPRTSLSPQDLRLFVRLSIMSVIKDQKGGSRRLYEFITPFVATSNSDALNEEWDSKWGYANEFTKCMTAIIADSSPTVKFAQEERQSNPQVPEDLAHLSFLAKLYERWRAGTNPLKGQFSQPLAKFFVTLAQRMQDFQTIYSQRKTLTISDPQFIKVRAIYQLWFPDADANFANPSNTDLGLAKFSALNYLNGYLSTGPQLPQMPMIPQISWGEQGNSAREARWEKRMKKLEENIATLSHIVMQDIQERGRQGPGGLYNSMHRQSSRASSMAPSSRASSMAPREGGWEESYPPSSQYSRHSSVYSNDPNASQRSSVYSTGPGLQEADNGFRDGEYTVQPQPQSQQQQSSNSDPSTPVPNEQQQAPPPRITNGEEDEDGYDKTSLDKTKQKNWQYRQARGERDKWEGSNPYAEQGGLGSKAGVYRVI